MLVPVHRAVSAVLHVMLVAFVTLSARVQHGVLRSIETGEKYHIPSIIAAQDTSGFMSENVPVALARQAQTCSS